MLLIISSVSCPVTYPYKFPSRSIIYVVGNAEIPYHSNSSPVSSISTGYVYPFSSINFVISETVPSCPIPGQCFRLDPADETGKVYELTAGDRYLKIEVAEDQKKVRFYCTQEEFEQFWKTYFDLDTCYADYLSLIKDDEYLKRAAGFGSGIRILQQDLWEMIVTFILSQQSNIPRIKSCRP